MTNIKGFTFCIIGTLILVLGVLGCAGEVLTTNGNAEPVASARNTSPPPANCAAGPIQDYGIGGEIALIPSRDGYALAFTTDTGQGDASSTLVLLDHNGLAQKSVALGAGSYPQVVSGNFNNTLATFQTNASGETAIGWMDADGSNFQQYRSPQNPSFLSPIFVDNVQGLSRQAWIAVEPNPYPATACVKIRLGDTESDGNMTWSPVTSLALRDGECLNKSLNSGSYGGSYDLQAFANGYATNVIAIHKSPDEEQNQLSLFIGDGTYQEIVLSTWHNDGPNMSDSFIEQINQLTTGGFVVPIQRWVSNHPNLIVPVFDPTRLLFLDENGQLINTFLVPHFMGYDTTPIGYWTTEAYLVTTTWEDDGTTSAFFHLMDMYGAPLHDLKLETVANDFSAQAKIVAGFPRGDPGYAFFAAWGGGLSAADIYNPIHGALITCK